MTTRRAMIAVWMLGLLAGCASDPSEGYTMEAPFRDDVQTVAVHLFTRSRSLYRRELEMRLTEAIVKRIELDTPYKVTDKSRADTLLTGTIEQVSQRVMSFNPDTAGAQEKEMIVTVSLHWKDLRTGEVLVDEPRVRAAGAYISAQPLGETFFEGSEGALDEVARRVVERMEADW
jgi:Lipopolysaccharide-assembly